MRTTEAVLAYWAGLFDGEGSVVIANHNNGSQLKVTLPNTYTPIVQELFQLFGGSYSEHPGVGINDKPFARWELSHKDNINRFLINILPYLRIKREQALIGLAFAKTVGNRGQRLTHEIKVLRESLESSLHKLNKRGKP